MICDELCFAGFRCDYDLKFKDRVTLIVNKSGEGKTLFYDSLEGGYAYFHKVHYVFADYRSFYRDDLQERLLTPNSLIVIDNATLLIDEKLAMQIMQNDSSQYIIFTTFIDAQKYKPTRNNLAEFCIDDEKTVRLHYLKE